MSHIERCNCQLCDCSMSSWCHVDIECLLCSPGLAVWYSVTMSHWLSLVICWTLMGQSVTKRLFARKSQSSVVEPSAKISCTDHTSAVRPHPFIYTRYGLVTYIHTCMHQSCHAFGFMCVCSDITVLLIMQKCWQLIWTVLWTCDTAKRRVCVSEILPNWSVKLSFICKWKMCHSVTLSS